MVNKQNCASALKTVFLLSSLTLFNKKLECFYVNSILFFVRNNYEVFAIIKNSILMLKLALDCISIIQTEQQNILYFFRR